MHVSLSSACDNQLQQQQKIATSAEKRLGAHSVAYVPNVLLEPLLVSLFDYLCINKLESRLAF